MQTPLTIRIGTPPNPPQVELPPQAGSSLLWGGSKSVKEAINSKK